MKLKTLENLEAFILSDRVTIKGSEFMATGALISEIQAEKAAMLNQQQVASRVRGVPDRANPPADAPASVLGAVLPRE